MPLGERVPVERFGQHLDAVPGGTRSPVATVAHDSGIAEVLVQVIDPFDHPVLERSADRDVVEHREMLYVFAKSDTTRVRTDRNLELRG